MFWSDGKQDIQCPCYDVCVASVGAGASVACVGAISVGSVGTATAAATAVAVGSTAVTVTEPVGAAVETGRSGTAP